MQHQHTLIRMLTLSRMFEELSKCFEKRYINGRWVTQLVFNVRTMRRIVNEQVQQSEWRVTNTHSKLTQTTFAKYN